jgi:hypothetical protein
MARCIFCDEWAGHDSDRHERCVLEFEACMRQPDVFSLLLSHIRSTPRTVYTLLVSSLARPR